VLSRNGRLCTQPLANPRGKREPVRGINEIELIREMRFVNSVETEDPLYQTCEILPRSWETVAGPPEAPGTEGDGYVAHALNNWGNSGFGLKRLRGGAALRTSGHGTSRRG
jgi:hypothetical protein